MYTHLVDHADYEARLLDLVGFYGLFILQNLACKVLDVSIINTQRTKKKTCSANGATGRAGVRSYRNR